MTTPADGCDTIIIPPHIQYDSNSVDCSSISHSTLISAPTSYSGKNTSCIKTMSIPTGGMSTLQSSSINIGMSKFTSTVNMNCTTGDTINKTDKQSNMDDWQYAFDNNITSKNKDVLRHQVFKTARMNCRSQYLTWSPVIPLHVKDIIHTVRCAS